MKISSGKMKRMMKQLLRAAVNLLIFAAGTGLLLGFMMWREESIKDEIKQLTNRNRQTVSEIRQKTERGERAKNTLALYDRLTKDSDVESLSLNKDRITDRLNRLKEKYRLRDLSIRISPVSERPEPLFAKKTGTIITTKIELDFSAITDAHAFAFTKEVLDSFSGYLNLRSFSVERPLNLDSVYIEATLAEGKTDFVRGTLIFDWLGLRVNEPEPSEEGAPT